MNAQRAGQKRRFSELRYPYYDLAATIDVARRLFGERGGRVTEDGLAEMLGTAKAKSAFQTKINAAQLFGLLKRDGNALAVTDLALRIVKPRTPEDAAQATVEAFLSVPLFDAVQKRYAGNPLPPDDGLRNALELDFGVIPKRVPDAFATLMRSAERAGVLYRSGGNSYLSRGTGVGEPSRPDQPPVQPGVQQLVLPKVPDAGVPHPALGGLLQVLPDGANQWTEAERSRWLEAFQATIKVLYPTEEEQHAAGQ